MRIGQVTTYTGLSARVLRSYEARGWLQPAQVGTGHRHYRARDVRRARKLRALLAADVDPDLAVLVVDGLADADQRREVRRAVRDLSEQMQEAMLALDEDLPSEEDGPEYDISLMFDTFLARTRMESVITEAMRPVGLASSECELLTLIRVEGALTRATLARLVGAAPSTLVGRVGTLERRGLVRRLPHPDDPRSWRIELTAAGARMQQDAAPYRWACSARIDEALLVRGVRPDVVRTALQTLSAALRSLLPDGGRH